VGKWLPGHHSPSSHALEASVLLLSGLIFHAVDNIAPQSQCLYSAAKIPMSPCSLLAHLGVVHWVEFFPLVNLVSFENQKVLPNLQLYIKFTHFRLKFAQSILHYSHLIVISFGYCPQAIKNEKKNRFELFILILFTDCKSN
jgi:hypothetical protein